jgi:rare lipoprotein A
MLVIRAVAVGLWLATATLSFLLPLAEAAEAAPRHHAAHHRLHHAVHHAAMRHRHVAIDQSGAKQYGKASFYHPGRAGKRDGAASRTLPLGTRARVTNLQNGKSTEVEITDRGPYVRHRIIDVTPHAASALGIKKKGVAPVEVKPLDVPHAAATDEASR